MKRSSAESLKRQVMCVGAWILASLMVGLPIVDANHYQDALRDLKGQPLSCQHDGAIDQVAAIIFLSAGISTETGRAQLNQTEKRRAEGLTYLIDLLMRSGTPPKVIILAMGPEHEDVNPKIVLNYVQREYDKLNPGESIPEELFHIIHVKNTKSSMDEANKIIESKGLTGVNVVMTSEMHGRRALSDACGSEVEDVALVSAEQMISIYDLEQYQAMVANSQNLVHKRHELLEDIKRGIGYLVPNKLGLHTLPYAP